MTRLLLITGGLLASCIGACARTIEVTDSDCRRIAAISAEAPRLSWATWGYSGYLQTSQLELTHTVDRAFLIAFPLSRIPAGMRITSATFTMFCCLAYPQQGPRIEVRRIIGDWGPGVCHLYRRTRPEKVPWGEPGAAELGVDRARRATAVVPVQQVGELQVNVTEDVELWYSGKSDNNGWMVTVESKDTLLRFYSPTWTPGTWKLSVTYEPR